MVAGGKCFALLVLKLNRILVNSSKQVVLFEPTLLTNLAAFGGIRKSKYDNKYN